MTNTEQVQEYNSLELLLNAGVFMVMITFCFGVLHLLVASM